MKDSIKTKLERLTTRYHELSEMMGDPAVYSNQDKFREISKEFAQIEPIVNGFAKYSEAVDAQKSAETLSQDTDPEMRELAQAELQDAQANIAQCEQDLQVLMLPKDPDDERSAYLEIRAGTGGDEAALFAGDLFRMYSRYVEKMKWQLEIMNLHEGDHGGYKEIIVKIIGKDVYAQLKFESGVHRVQRVPETESQGRVHTSAVTVAILPEVEAIRAVEINTDEIRVDTFRSSGAGGQHVNKTDSAIRLTHLPTGVVVECQEERSQHKNRAKAMSLLQSKLLHMQQEEQRQTQADTRRSLVGSGDRSERIRTYNFPQGRVTDHRINLTLYKLPQIMEGELDEVIQTLSQEHQADLLAAIGD